MPNMPTFGMFLSVNVVGMEEYFVNRWKLFQFELNEWIELEWWLNLNYPIVTFCTHTYYKLDQSFTKYFRNCMKRLDQTVVLFNHPLLLFLSTFIKRLPCNSSQVHK